jgi:hypothetical protein
MAQAELERRNYTVEFETLGKKGHLKRVERGEGLGKSLVYNHTTQ